MVNYTKRILIFALARTASTTLMNLLNVHKSIYAISEPFNIGNKENVRRMGIEGLCENEISSFKDLDEILEKIFFDFNLVKHVWHHSGFPFVNQDLEYAFNGSLTLNEYLLTKFDYVILLRRRNVLKRIVSSLMSEQTGFWDSYQLEVKGRPEGFIYEPLNLSVIEWHVKHERFYEYFMKQSLQKRNIDYIEVIQEDLLNRKLSVEEKIEKFIEITDFVKLPKKFNYDQMMIVGDYLTAAKHRHNSFDSYKGIPNAIEIEEKFGSDETGWLFK